MCVCATVLVIGFVCIGTVWGKRGVVPCLQCVIMSLSNAFNLPFPEQKQEGERFSYEVCDSKHLLIFLTAFPMAQEPLHYQGFHECIDVMAPQTVLNWFSPQVYAPDCSLDKKKKDAFLLRIGTKIMSFKKCQCSHCNLQVLGYRQLGSAWLYTDLSSLKPTEYTKGLWGPPRVKLGSWWFHCCGPH